MSASALRLQAFHAHVRALNALVSAVEKFEGKLIEPSYPSWDSSPESFGASGQRDIDRAEAISLGKSWENFASKLDDAMGCVNFDDLREQLSDLQTTAERAREALLALNAYDGAYPEKV